MKKSILTIIGLVALVSQGVVLEETVSDSVAIDLDPHVHIVAPETSLLVEYSPDFAGAKGPKSVRVLNNGEIVVQSTMAGTKTLSLGDSGVWQLKHQVLANGVVVDERVACYAVATNGTVVLQDIWTEVPADLFRDCDWLTSVTIPSGVTNVAARAFKGCSSLTDLILPDTLVSVGDEAFCGCSSLKALTLPESVVTLGSSALRDCSNLSTLALSRNLTVLPDYVLSGCSALDCFTVPETVRKIGKRFVSSRVTAIYYMGDAPAYDEEAYADARSTLTSYVKLNTKGWDGDLASRDLPTQWPTTVGCSRPLELWAANQYDVAFDANGGIFAPVATNIYTCEQITHEWYVLPPYQPTRTGYKFNGYWTEPSGGTRIYSSTGVELTKPHTLYAHWAKGVEVTVRFNANGGTVSPEEGAYTAETPYATFPVPTREHYEFVGWYTEATGGRQIIESTEVSVSDDELFAHWTPCTYMLRYHANNGTDATRDTSFRYGDDIELSSGGTMFDAPSDCYYVGWSLTPGGEAVYSDVSVMRDAANIEDGVVHLWALWAGKTYAVRFDSHGGTGQMMNQTFSIGVGQPLTANAFSREPFVFGGWSRSTEGGVDYPDRAIVTDLTSEKGGTVVLYAVWVRASGNSLVTFEVNGGALATNQFELAARGAYGELPVPTRSGYTFEAWQTREGEVVTANSTVPQVDVTLYAIWSPNKYTVVFAANGGSGTMADQAFVYDVAQALAANAFVRDGYSFDGWGRDGEGAVATHADGAVVSNLTFEANDRVVLTARWLQNAAPPSGPEDDPVTPTVTNTVTFNANGGSVGEETRLIAERATIGGLPTALRLGYDFAGWFTAANGGERVMPDMPVVSDLMVYAHWTPVAYVISYELNGGENSSANPMSYTVESATIALLPPVRDGYRFAGWTPDGVIAAGSTGDKAFVAGWEKVEFDKFSGIVGVSFSYDLGEFLSGLELDRGKCTLKNQPVGIKADAKNGLLAGVPTKAGTYTVIVTDSAKNKKMVTFTVKALPSWAVGTFNGFIEEGDARGTATLTVGKNGKASGKFIVIGKSWSFSATSYAQESTDEKLILVGTAKSGKSVRVVRLEVTGEGLSLKNGRVVGLMDDAKLTLWRNVWKDFGAGNAVSPLTGLYTVQVCGDETGCGYLLLKVDAKGGVKASGKMPDGVSAASTLTLVSGDGNGGGLFAIWAMAPSAYKGGAVTGLLRFSEEKPRVIEGEDCRWSNLSPTATGVYGEGFASALTVEGAWYDTNESLRMHYASGLAFFADAPTLDGTVGAADLSCWKNLTVSVDSKGTGFVVDQGKATKPVQDKATKEWSYEGDNDTALTVSFAKATGIFKGLFTCWYDYVDQNGRMKHTSKKASFEGVMVQGEPLRGFYLWERQSTSGGKAYKYKESRSIAFGEPSEEQRPATEDVYCVIDLSAGPAARTYPVSYLTDIPAGGWTDDFKTTKLVLRRIESGSFKMSGLYDVTLTMPYYIGVFEVTQKQYELVAGEKPSYFSGDTRPVEQVSWNMIKERVIPKLQQKTGMSFDLPTEAQWEYACRAGATTTYNYGNDANGEYMWYSGNSGSQTHDVGTRKPNAWGLYDMHGNVCEWCLDWSGSLSSSTDPTGPGSGSSRVIRFGGWISSEYECTSSERCCGVDPSVQANIVGFRLSRNLQNK